MALNIKNERAERLAREAAQRTGQSITDVLITALDVYLAQLPPAGARPGTSEEIDRILREYRRLPLLDERPGAAIVDDLYGEDGLPR